MPERAGAVEAGGTKFRVGFGIAPAIDDAVTIPTTTPEETLTAVLDHLRRYEVGKVGIASFGPIDLSPQSPTFGELMSTPKRGWAGVNILKHIGENLRVPVVIDTDVAAAGLAEWKWGAGRGHRTVLYLTIGTGVGGALLVEGKTHYGHGHSEMGHIALERIEGDRFAGACPYHSGCLEGMAAGPAIRARWGTELLEAGSAAMELEAAYLAQALRTLTYVLAPDVIVIGGGVMQNPGLLETARGKLVAELSDYSTNPSMLEAPGSYLVAPAFGQDAGLVGALTLVLDED